MVTLLSLVNSVGYGLCFCGCSWFLGFFICVVAVLSGVTMFADWFVAGCGFVRLLVLGVCDYRVGVINVAMFGCV